MDKLNEVLNRLKGQYKSYEKERDNEDEEGFIDLSVACNLADSIPYLIKNIEKLQKEKHELKCHIEEVEIKVQQRMEYLERNGAELRLRELSEFNGWLLCGDDYKSQ